MHAVLLQRGWTVLATSISSLLLEYDVLQLSVELTEGGTQSCERFVSVNWEFSQFSTSSAANSLPVHGTFEGQNKSTLGPEKTKFSVFWNFSSLGFYIWSTWCLRKKKNLCHGHLNYHVTLTHRRSTTISLETYLLLTWYHVEFKVVGVMPLFAGWLKMHNKTLSLSMNYKTSCMCYLPKLQTSALIIHDITLNLIQ